MTWYKVQQNTPEWLELRKGVLTASKFSKCITEKKQNISKAGIKNVVQQLKEDISGIEREPGYVSEYMQYGNDWEDTARQVLRNKLTYDIKSVGFCKREFKDIEIGCSPDGMYKCDRLGFVGAEIKCPGMKQHLINNGHCIDKQIPLKYMAQIQYSMYVTGSEMWWFASFRHDSFIGYHAVSKDEDYFENKIIPVLDEINNNLKEYRHES